MNLPHAQHILVSNIHVPNANDSSVLFPPGHVLTNGTNILRRFSLLFTSGDSSALLDFLATLQWSHSAQVWRNLLTLVDTAIPDLSGACWSTMTALRVQRKGGAIISHCAHTWPFVLEIWTFFRHLAQHFRVLSLAEPETSGPFDQLRWSKAF